MATRYSSNFTSRGTPTIMGISGTGGRRDAVIGQIG
jgi:hypothetical protein